jgi:hypothetical protein
MDTHTMMLSAPAIAPPRRTPRTTRLGLLVGAVPTFMLILWQWVAAPTFFGPLGVRRPELLGIPVELIVTGLAVGWGAIGGFVVARSTTRWVVPYVLLIFTIPACVLILFAPVIVLIMQNWGS